MKKILNLSNILVLITIIITLVSFIGIDISIFHTNIYHLIIEPIKNIYKKGINGYGDIFILISGILTISIPFFVLMNYFFQRIKMKAISFILILISLISSFIYFLIIDNDIGVIDNFNKLDFKSSIIFVVFILGLFFLLILYYVKLIKFSLDINNKILLYFSLSPFILLLFIFFSGFIQLLFYGYFNFIGFIIILLIFGGIYFYKNKTTGNKANIKDITSKINLIKTEDKLKDIQKVLYMIFSKIKFFLIKYTPILISKLKIIEKQTLKEGKKLSKNINKKVKNIDADKYVNIGINNISRVKNIKFSHKNKKYFLSIILLLITIFVGNYTYNNFYYYNQIIKVGNSISLKKQPDIISYFNNNKIKIGINDEDKILSQSLLSARSYEDMNGYINYKVGGYVSIYPINDDIYIEDIKDNEKNLGIIVDKEKKGEVEIITYNENIDEFNLYDLGLFDELNSFTNRNTFYSSISNIYNENILINGLIGEKIENLFGIDELLKDLDREIRKSVLILGNYKNHILGLELDNNKLIIKLKYNFDEVNFVDKVMIEDSIFQILNNINEENIINYSSYDILYEKNSITIKSVYKISNSDLENIRNDKGLNIISELNDFTTINNY